MQLLKSFLLPLISLTRYNLRWVLTYLILSWHAWTMSLCPFWVTWPWSYLLCASFSCFSGASCLFMQASCHLHLLFYTWGWSVLEFGGADSWKINQVCWIPLLSTNISCEVLLRRWLNRTNTWSPEVQGCDPALCLAPFVIHLMVIAAKLDPSFNPQLVLYFEVPGPAKIFLVSHLY